jgi:hypothetical protein
VVVDGTATVVGGTAAVVDGVADGMAPECGMARECGVARECGMAPLGVVQRGTAASFRIVTLLSFIAIASSDRSSGSMPLATRRVGAGSRAPSDGDGFGSVTDPQSPALANGG